MRGGKRKREGQDIGISQCDLQVQLTGLLYFGFSFLCSLPLTACQSNFEKSNTAEGHRRESFFTAWWQLAPTAVPAAFCFLKNACVAFNRIIMKPVHDHEGELFLVRLLFWNGSYSDQAAVRGHNGLGFGSGQSAGRQRAFLVSGPKKKKKIGRSWTTTKKVCFT